MLGAASVNGCTMAGLIRWKRLISPHGVFQEPNCCVNRSDAAASAASFTCGVVWFNNTESVETHAPRPAGPARRPNSSPQKTARLVGTDAADQRRSQLRNIAICSATFAFNESPAGA